MFEFKDYELKKVSTHLCNNCDVISKVYISHKETKFCPACGSNELYSWKVGDEKFWLQDEKEE